MMFDASEATLENWHGWVKAVKKPIPIDAVQMNLPEGFFVQTLEGRMEGKPGDYLIRGVRGELYPCAREIFEETYDVTST